MSYGLPNEALSGCRRTKSSTLMNFHYETHLNLQSNSDMYMWNQVNYNQNHYANVGTSAPYNHCSYPKESCPHQSASRAIQAVAGHLILVYRCTRHPSAYALATARCTTTVVAPDVARSSCVRASARKSSQPALDHNPSSCFPPHDRSPPAH